jgi:hypothetical protein
MKFLIMQYNKNKFEWKGHSGRKCWSLFLYPGELRKYHKHCLFTARHISR